MAEETLAFQAEVAKLLQIVANSLYSRKEVFLRELISNASDACDRLRYAALTDPALAGGDAAFRVVLRADAKARTLAVEDNGVGMTRQELIDNLGTIARSGSAAFLGEVTGDAGKDVSLIGRFGVGFYSAFIVADKVEVTSLRAGESQAWRWTSDGQGAFSVAEAERAGHGTTVLLHLKKDAKEFLEEDELRRVVKTHSDHIGIPVAFAGKDGEKTLNAASALWTRPRKDITEEQYREFYQHLAHGFDEPWATLHARAEGRLEYTLLLFIPSQRPFDLFQPDRKCPLRLYVRRVFVTDDTEGLVPSWLRFLRGVVDAEDIPLNVSREMLQHDPVLARIGAALVKRVLGELEKRAEKDPADYAAFWANFGAVLKEGLYEDASHREALLGLARFHSTAGEGLTSLSEYVARMGEAQSEIYTIAGDDLAQLRKSPQIEGFAARGFEVLLLTDAVDEFWVPAVGAFEGKAFTSVTRAGGKFPPADDAKPREEADPGIAILVAAIKQGLGEAVADVRTSDRLTASPVCLVAAEADLDRHLARMLRQAGQLNEPSRGVLEINPRHPLIRALAAAVQTSGADAAADAAHLLLDQARILDGESPVDAAAFARRMTEVMARVWPAPRAGGDEPG